MHNDNIDDVTDFTSKQAETFDNITDSYDSDILENANVPDIDFDGHEIDPDTLEHGTNALDNLSDLASEKINKLNTLSENFDFPWEAE